ncbi:MAG TPA: RIP metalloprotease RseP [Bacteroidales bacterium]|nr:RIP metalloprotease RseP [Bacteroidales bacterium]
METFFIRAAQLILSLSILVVLHELGHFGFSRLFKVRVDKFYVFFNPKRSLIRAKKINGKWQVKFFAPNVPPNERIKLDADGNPMMDGKHHVMEQVPLSELPEGDWRRYPESTEWGIGWLPLGGYCKIAGMVDESMDTTQLAQEPQPWEFRTQSVWKRFWIISGGVIVNFLLALVIYAAILFTWGRSYLPLENLKYGLNFSQTMIDAGFRDGDKIIDIDGRVPVQLGDAVEMILIDKAEVVKVERNGTPINIELPTDLTQKVLASQKAAISYRMPFVIDTVISGSLAAKANLRVGDSLVAINDKQINMQQEVVRELADMKGQNISLDYYRDGILYRAKMKLGEDGKLGVGWKNYFKIEREEYGFLEAIPAGIKMGVDRLVGYVKQFKLVFTKEGAKSIGSFGALGQLFPPTWDWLSFWEMTALISLILAFMNFLPIPGLDGGYIMFLIYEMITRRKPSDRFMEVAQMVGMGLLMLLFVYAIGNDIFRAFK